MRVNGIIFYGQNNERGPAIDFLTNKLERLYRQEAPTRVINSINEYRVEYGQDCWRCFKASENRRGFRANIIFYSSTIDEDIVHCIIYPMCNGIIQKIYLN